MYQGITQPCQHLVLRTIPFMASATHVQRKRTVSCTKQQSPSPSITMRTLDMLIRHSNLQTLSITMLHRARSWKLVKEHATEKVDTERTLYPKMQQRLRMWNLHLYIMCLNEVNSFVFLIWLGFLIWSGLLIYLLNWWSGNIVRGR